MRLAKNIVVGMAAAGMLAMPIAAQAGTRAGDANVRVSPVAETVTTGAARTGAAVSEENRAGGSATILAILAAAAVILGIVIAVDDDGSDGA